MEHDYGTSMEEQALSVTNFETAFGARLLLEPASRKRPSKAKRVVERYLTSFMPGHGKPETFLMRFATQFWEIIGLPLHTIIHGLLALGIACRPLHLSCIVDTVCVQSYREERQEWSVIRKAKKSPRVLLLFESKWSLSTSDMSFLYHSTVG